MSLSVSPEPSQAQTEPPATRRSTLRMQGLPELVGTAQHSPTNRQTVQTQPGMMVTEPRRELEMTVGTSPGGTQVPLHVPIRPGPGVDAEELRGWAARKMMYEDARWVYDIVGSAGVSSDLTAFAGLFLSHQFVRVAYEGATALRSSNPHVGIPEFAAGLSDQYAAVSARYRHATKLLDDNSKTLTDVLAELRTEIELHRQAFTGKTGRWLRWAETDLGLYLHGDDLLGATVPASFRLGVDVGGQAKHKTGEDLSAVTEECGGALAYMCGATFVPDDPAPVLDLRTVRIRSRDCRADRYLAGKFEARFPLELKMLLLLIEGDLNTSRLILPATSSGHRDAVLRAQTVTLVHSLTALQRIASMTGTTSSRGLIGLGELLDSPPVSRLTSPMGLLVRNRFVHYEMNDPRILPDLTTPMCGLVEQVFPGETWLSLSRDVADVTERAANFISHWAP